MSYSRWSNSSWYSFYNVNGRLSLWLDMEHTIDWEYDDLIDKNPNRRVYAGKTSLFETKNNDYFLNGQQDKVNRGIGSTWSLYDVA